MKQSLLFFTAALFFFSACTGPTIPEDDINLGYSQTGSTNQNQTNQNTQSQTTPTKEPMKSLADFETITASQATITTTKGDITVELYQDKAPVTVANFLNLAKSGFYNDIVFHRVIADFMAQVGDPLSKDPSQQAAWGSGGPGYVIPDEFDPSLKHDSPGMLSMANRGPNTGGSQFFITYEPTPWLDGKHAIFGKVTQGMDVLEQIEIGDKIVAISYQ